MRLLFDQNLSFKLCDLLSDLFPDSRQVGRIGLGQADDQTVWKYAAEGGFILVSQEADFVELALLEPPRGKFVWLRCGNRPTAKIEALMRSRSEAILAFGQDPSAVCLEVY